MRYSTIAAAGFVAAVQAQTAYVYETVTAVTTYCPEATSLTHNGVTYTITEATTLTISNCPCTLTHAVMNGTTIASSSFAPVTSSTSVSTTTNTKTNTVTVSPVTNTNTNTLTVTKTCTDAVCKSTSYTTTTTVVPGASSASSGSGSGKPTGPAPALSTSTLTNTIPQTQTLVVSTKSSVAPYMNGTATMSATVPAGTAPGAKVTPYNPSGNSAAQTSAFGLAAFVAVAAYFL